ncbi:TonB-dependent receptor [Saprospira sp. CCB-QB6]|uniref:TonB-dependent receptor n=1 Tax=Saprospira sp. CCB-QB6 TaxID=3023936 RepID=UPI00234903C0|nr:TonB-dependent receptor [Saprospira sp. CCB-QB6]WCL80400.1 TonB-dependent receptor [Saprospira sp. CCB-QB6]
MKAKKHYLLAIYLLLYSLHLGAQTASLQGYLYDSQAQPIPFAGIGLIEQQKGTASLESGYFYLDGLAPGHFELQIQAIGFQSQSINIELKANDTLKLDSLLLKEDILGLEEVVVSGQLKESFLKNSAVKIQVYRAEYLEQTTAPTNLMQALKLINGVQEVVACGVCFTNSISINGLPGPYTAVLIDGSPAYGNLASVYGLNGIPKNMIDRIEVIKGPNSTLYGSEAMAGVINVITKDPSKQAAVSLDLMGTTHAEAFSNLALSQKLGRLNASLGLQHAYLNRFDDANQDGFGDNIAMDRLSVFGKFTFDRPNNKKASLFAKYYYEDRRNGVEQYTKDRAYQEIRGNDSIYGESIYTQRFELMGSYELPTQAPIRLDYSFSQHHQDSYYGSDGYLAQQRIAYLNALYMPNFGPKHNLTAGLTARYQFYDDNTLVTSKADEQFIPGLWAQHEWKPQGEKWTFLSGLRLDYYEAHGLIPSPRISIKYEPRPYWKIRLNTGTGFRLVNLFAEDHAFVTGNRQLILAEKLAPEQALSSTLNIQRIFNWGQGQGSIDLDAFYTHFINAIIPNYEQANSIIYENLDGYAQSRGLALNLNYGLPAGLQINLGATYQYVFEYRKNEQGLKEKRELEYSPKFSGVLTINYHYKPWNLRAAYTANFTGQMQLPEVYDLDQNGQPLPQARSTRSQAFSIHNLQLTKQFPKRQLDIYLGAQNLFNYRQKSSPLSGLNDPNAAVGFSDYFDTAYAYSPLHGREFYLGIRWNFR